MDDRFRWNLLVGLALAFTVVHYAGFLAALMGSKAGEISGALGGLLGGILGAGGAVIAVFLTLWRQRDEDAAKVSDAVQNEVRGLIKFVIGAIETCQRVVAGTRSIPVPEARYIVVKLYPPTIYPAVADKVGLLPQPEGTIEFYARLLEAKALIEALVSVRRLRGTTVTREQAKPVANALLLALFAARAIIAEPSRSPPRRSRFAPDPAKIQRETLSQIDACLGAVPTWLPDAEVVTAMQLTRGG